MLKCKTFTSQYGYVDEIFNKFIQENNIRKEQIYMLRYLRDKEHTVFLVYDDEAQEQMMFTTQDIQRLLDTPYTEEPYFLNQNVVH